jgi:hypothetical protein
LSDTGRWLGERFGQVSVVAIALQNGVSRKRSTMAVSLYGFQNGVNGCALPMIGRGLR